MRPSRGRLSLLTFFGLLLAGLRPGRALSQSATIAPVRGVVTEAGKATPLPGAVLRWLWDVPDATAPVITTISDEAGHFLLTRPARAASSLVVQALGYSPNMVVVPVTCAPYLRVALRAGKELGEVTVTARGPAYSALTPANVQIISARDLTKYTCCNLAESFETNA